MKTVTPAAWNRRQRMVSRTRRSRREPRHALRELVASATRALAILRARAAQHTDDRNLGTATGR